MNDDGTYYRRRAAQEDERARMAKCKEARARHLELAAAYRLKCAANSNSVRRAWAPDVAPISTSRR